MKYQVLTLLFLSVCPVVVAVNDIWIGCRYSVALSFSGADLGRKNAPKPQATPMPGFPAGQMNGETVGEVIVDFTVGREGALSEIRVVSATGDDFRDATLLAVRSWKFSPAIDLTSGHPVSARMRCKIDFTAAEKESPNKASEPTAINPPPAANSVAPLAHL